ncbi:unnamed protein product [Rhizopus microsporus]
MGISLLVHPDCPYEVTHFPSTSPYVLTCPVSNMLIHCIYLPPALSVDEAIAVLDNLLIQTHSSQHNTQHSTLFMRTSYTFFSATYCFLFYYPIKSVIITPRRGAMPTLATSPCLLIKKVFYLGHNDTLLPSC